MRRYLYVSTDTLPIIAFADSKAGMRSYVRHALGLPFDMPLPRHAIVSIA